jgi:hypothetical protein
MKDKIVAGLMLFSQAAQAVTTIDKNNYRQHLCDSGLFIPVVREGTTPAENWWEKGFINQDYQVYCGTKANYERAVEDSNKRGVNHYPCLGNQKDMITKDACVEKHGIEYAQTCERLKEDREKYRAAWNSMMPVTSCNNMRRMRRR